MRSQKELESLIEELNLSYREGNEEVSDEYWDKLMDELKTNYPDSPLLKVGVIKIKPKTRKEEPPITMASLDKYKTIADVVKWLESKGIGDDELLVITGKYDGISLSDTATKCWTKNQRSDNHFSKMNSNNQEHFITFGEAEISKKNWKEHFEGKNNPHSGDPYKNARNTVAGLFNNDTPVEELKYVDYIRYGIGNSSLDKYKQIRTLNEINKVLCKMATIKFKRFRELPIEDITDLYNSWNKDYAIDGLVIDINDAELRKSLGREENGNPAYARAIKLPEWSQDNKTTITGHKFSISKQGLLKGTVKINPVIIDGVEVKQATFYNAAFLLDWALIKGRNIEVKRSGDVIPKIVTVEGIHVPLKEEFKTAKEYKEAYDLATSEITNRFGNNIDVDHFVDELMICSSCGEPLKWNKNLVELVCTNTEYCKDIKVSKLVHFFKTLGFEDFGEESIVKLYDSGTQSVQAYLNLTVDNLYVLDGWGKISAKKFLNQIVNIQDHTVSFAKLTAALDCYNGILGEKECQNIIDNIPEQTLFNLEQRGLDITSDLLLINGVGEITATAFQNGYNKWREDFKHLPIYCSYFKTPIQAPTGNKCDGWCACLTGFRSDKITAFIKANGGNITGKVSKKTTHLLTKDVNSTSGSMIKAKDFGCEIISREKFEAKYL
jgi:DNA ligase (NAD+)